MKQLILFAAGFLTAMTAAAQAPGIEWKYVYTQFPTVESGSCISPTSDGGYIVGSVSASNAWIFKIDASGAQQWDNYIPNDTTTGVTAIYDIEQTSDNGYIAAGSDYAPNGDSIGSHGIRDFLVIKMDQNGAIQWIKALGGSSNEEARSVAQTTDGGYIVVGYTGSNDGDLNGNPIPWYTEYWIVKLDASGNIVWQKAYGGSNYDWATSVAATPDGGAIVAGYSGSKDSDAAGTHWGGSDDDMWVLKLDASGNIDWQKAYGGSAEDQAWSVNLTADGGYLIAGSTASNDGLVTGIHDPSNALRDFWAVKIDAAGTLTWQKCLGGTGNDIAYSAQQTTDGGYILAGTVEPTSTSGVDITGYHGNAGSDYWVAKLNATGDLDWQKCLGGSGTEDARSIAETGDGGYIVAGTEHSSDGDVNYTDDVLYSHIWVVKLGGSGTNALEETGVLHPELYPNPSNEALTVANLPAGSHIMVSNLAGQSVYNVTVQDNLSTVVTKDLPAGMYLLRIQYGGETVTARCVVRH